MGKSFDKSMRLAAARVLEQIPTEAGVQLLLDMGNDSDGDVKREVIRILYKIYDRKNIEFSKNVKEMVEKFLHSVKKTWVVE